MSVAIGLVLDELNRMPVVRPAQIPELAYEGEFTLDERTSIIQDEGGKEYIVVRLVGKNERFEYYEDISARASLGDASSFKVSSRVMTEASVPSCDYLIMVTIEGVCNGVVVYKTILIFDRNGEQIFPNPPARPAPKGNDQKKEKRYGRSGELLMATNY